jgi:hypothetical protein
MALLTIENNIITACTRPLSGLGSHPEELGWSISSPLPPQEADI